MSKRPDHSTSWRGWGIFSSRRGPTAYKRDAASRQQRVRERARFLRLETLESRELLAAIAKFDFDAGVSETGPAGWTHYYPGINGTDQVVDATSQIGVRLLSGTPQPFTATYVTTTVPTDAVNANIKNGVISNSGSNSLVYAFTGLDLSKSYEIWVLGGNVTGSTLSQQVTVQGGQGTASFSQSIPSSSLVVNGSTGLNTKATTDFAAGFIQAPFFDADLGTNAISFTVDAATGRARIAGAVIREVVLPSTATLPTSGGPFTLMMDSGNRLLKNNSGTVVTTLASTGAITINGTDGASDRLKIDFTGGNPLTGGVTFNGGEQTGDDDRLSLSGYSLTTADGVADVTLNHTGLGAGSVVLAGLGTVNFTQVEPLALAGSAADLVITLPAGPHTNASLGDDGVAPFDGTNDANTSAIYDMLVPSTFEYTEFTNPTNTLKINRGSDSNSLTVQSLVAAGFDAALTIGAAGSELANVTFNGSITLTGNKGLSATASKSITLNPSATITTTSGNISLSANQQATPGAASFFGIDVFGAVVKSTSGNITLAGRGGTNADGQVGVLLEGSAVVGGVTPASATTGTITITGTGGSSSGNGGNSGVRVDSSSTINSNGGDIQITGTGGTSAAITLGANHGVSIDGSINTVGSGKLTITGNGATAPAGAGHLGVSVTGSVQTVGGKLSLTGTGDLGVQIDGLVSAGADVDVSGMPAANGGIGIQVTGNVNTFSAGNIKFTADGMNLGGSISPQSRSVTLLPKTVNRTINLGGADSSTQLGLMDGELDAVTAGTLNIGDANSGTITVSADITRSAATAVNLASGGAVSLASGLLDTAGGSATVAPGSLTQATFGKSGTDVSMLIVAGLPGTLNFASGADVALAINGLTADSQYEVLNVAGNVNLTGTDLVVSGGHTPAAGDTFTVVKYTGTRTGAFSNSTVALNGKTLNVVYDDANKQVLLTLPAPVTGTLSATLTGGNLTIADTDVTGKNNSLTVSATAGNLVITDAVEQFASAPAGGVLSNGNKTLMIPLTVVTGSLTINGADGSDSTTIDLSGGSPFPAGGIAINGGNPTTGPGDSLAITGGNQGTVTYNYTNAHDGNIVLESFGTVIYTGLEPITNSGTATDVVFNLPAGLNTVTLGDDGTSGNGLSRLSGATIELTDFANPLGTVTINRGTAGDSLAVNSLPDLTAGIKVGSIANPLAMTSFVGAVALGTGKSLSVSSLAVNMSPAAAISVLGGGSVTVVADDVAIDLAASVTATGGTVSISTLTANRSINLGTETSGKLSLSDGELDRVSGAVINIGSLVGGGLTISSAVDRTAGSTTAINLTAGGNDSIVFSGTGSLDAKNGNVTLLTNPAGTGSITSGSAAVDVSGSKVSLRAGSGGIGRVFLGSPASFVIAATDFDATTGGNGDQYLSVNGATTIDAVGLSAGTGTISFIDGIFNLGASNRIDVNSSIFVNGGTLALGTNNQSVAGVMLNTGSITGPGTLTSSTTFKTMSGTISAVLAGADSSVGLIQSTPGTTTLSGSNTYSGDTVITSSGLLALGNNDVIPDGPGKGNVVFSSASNSASLSMRGFSDTINGLSDTGAVDSAILTSNAGSTSILTIGNNDQTSTFSGVIRGGSGTLSIRKIGAGTLTLSGANTYEGDTVISAGTLKYGATNAIPGFGNVVFNPPSGAATLDLSGFSAAINGLSNSGAGASVIDNSVIGGPLTLTIGANNAGGDFGGVIKNTAGVMAVSKTGTGQLLLSGANTYSGGTSVLQGTLKTAGSGVLPSGGNVSTKSGTTLNLGGSQTLGSLTSLDSLGGDTVTNSAAATLTIRDSGSFYGTIANGSGGTLTSLVVDAAGKTVDLFGNNSYTGPTTVTAGTLLVDGFGGTNLTSSVTVGSGGTLGGSGKIASANTVTVNSGGHLAPTVLNSGSVSFSSGASFDVRLNGTTLGGGYNQQNVTGAVNLGGATLNVSLGFTPAVGNTFPIIVNDGTTDAVSGTFNGLPEGTVMNVTAGSFSAALQISYVGGDGNDVVLKAVSMSPVLDGTAGNDTWLVTKNASNGNTDISLNGTVVLSTAGLTGITINGQSGSDLVTVDLSAGNVIPIGGITFNGGENTGDDDRLKITGYNLTTADGVADVTVAHTGPEAGSVLLAGLGTVFFTQIEPLALAGTAADLVITLPAGPNPDATLGDDGVAALGDATNDANTSAIYDSTTPGATFEYTEFTNPTNSLTINRGSATDNLTVLDLVTSGLNAGLTIGAAGAEFGKVSFTGPITLATNRGLSANVSTTTNSGSINLTSAAKLAVSGTGGVNFTTTRDITLAAGSTITTVDGAVNFNANTQTPATSATFVGISIAGSITTSGTGAVNLVGRGGTSSAAQNYGVWINGGQVKSTGTGAAAGGISITGTGGTGTGTGNVGVEMDTSAANVASVNGNISITGTSGGTASISQDGIRQTGAPRIDITGTGTLTLTGTPGLTTGGNNGVGLRLAGPMDVTGSQTTLISNRMAFDPANFSLNTHGNTALLRPLTNGTPIDVGSTTETNATVTLELSDAELDRITTGTLQIGNANSGTISITSVVARPALTNVNLVSNGSINFTTGSLNTAGGNLTLTPAASGSVGVATQTTDTTIGAGTLSFASGTDLSIVINGTQQDSGFQRLTASGNINLSNVDLLFSGSYNPQVGDSFTIVNNTSVGSTTGTFNNLPDKFIFNPHVFNTAPGKSLPANVNADLYITYNGAGNDVILTAINIAPTLNSISDPVTILEGAGLQTINLSGITAGGTIPQTLTLTATSSNPTLIASPISVNYTSAGSTGSLSYTPEPGQFGTAVITVTVKDNGGVFGSLDQDTVVRTFVVRVAEVNDAPTGVDDAVADIAEDSGNLAIPFADLLGNDLAGPDSESIQTLTITAVNNVVGGTAVIQGTDVLFTPALNYNGPASFVYTLRDNGTTNGVNDFKTSTATVTFNITDKNDPPSGGNDSLGSIAEDSAGRTISIASLLANDVPGPSDESGQTLNLTAVSDAVGGTVAINGANIVFTPAPDFNGVASFRYTVTDDGTTNGSADPQSAMVTVSFAVAEKNDAPTGTNDSLASIAEDSGDRTIPMASLLANDSQGPANEAGQTLTITSVSNAVGGTVQIGSGSAAIVIFTPTADYSGPASFVYTFRDDGTTNGAADFLTSTATVSFTITEKNDPPVGTSDSLTSIAEDAGDRTISIADLLTNDTTGPANETSQTLTLISLVSAVGGTVQINGANIIFTPTAEYNGPASFVYTLRDDGTTDGVADPQTATATVNFTITEQNDAPIGVDDPLSVIGEDSGDRVIPFVDLLGNDVKGPANESGQTLTIVSVGSPVGGTVQINGTNVIFSPAADYGGPASFVYTLRDDGTTNGPSDFLTSTATVSFTISEKNDPPTGTDDFPQAIAEDGGPQPFAIVDLLSNDFTGPSNESGQTLTLDSVGAAVGGTVQIVGQSVVFTPTANYNGPASFQYTFHDDGTTNGSADPQTGSATVRFTIYEVNDPPNAMDDPLPVITEDFGPFPIFLADLLANDTTGPANESSQVLTFLSPSGVVGGTAQISGSQVTFLPADDFNGTASFVYSLRDNGTTDGILDAKTASAVVSFKISEINDVPIGHSDSLADISGNSGPRTIPFADLLGNDEAGPANESNQSLTISDVSSAVGGTVEINSLTQTIIFTPAANFEGPASFTYTLQDDGTTNGELDVRSGLATVTFNITRVNNAPTLTVNLPPLTAGAITPQLVADLNPGSASSIVGPIEVVNGVAYFSAESPSAGIELWRSDGTAAGTKLVKDIFSGAGSSQPSELTNIGGVLYFRADDGIHGFELWKSDGTENGTVLVKDLVTDSNFGSYPGNFIEVNGKLFFTAADQPSGSTTLLGPSPYRSSADSPFNLSGVGNDFQLEDFEDGQLNTLGVAAIGGGVRAPSSLTDSVDADDGTIDGSGNLGYDYLVRPGSSGITFVFDANALGGLPSNVGIVITNGFGGSPSAFVEYFDASGLLITKQTNTIENINTTSADDRFLGAFHAGGIKMIRVSSVGAGNSGLEVDHLQYGNIVQPTGSAGLWTSDGTSDGTKLLKNFSFTPDFGAVSLNDKLIFTADDGTSGTELWTSDGTPVGTVQIMDIHAGAASSNPKSLTKFENTVFFQADDGLAGAELWMTDGSLGGTSLFKDINAGAESSNPDELTDVNGTLFFSASTAQSGVELWKSDGTESGTVLVKDIRPGANGSGASGFTAVGDTVYFGANDNVHQFELWKSDGTAAGTVMVKDIITGANSSSPMSLSNISDRLLFSAFTGTAGHELWFSDGTDSGTTLIKDILPGSRFSAPLDIVALPHWIVFTANNGTNGRELWAASSDVMTVSEDADTQTIDLTGISAGANDLQSLTITVTSDNPGLIPNPTIDYTSPNTAGTLSFKPTADQFGTAVITVTIQDDGGTSNGGVDTLVRTFTIIVSPVNDPPTFQIAGNQSAADENPATKGPALPQVVTGWASNISLGPANETSQAASFVITNSNPSLFASQPTVDPDGTLRYTPKPNAHGIANLTVQLVDGGDGTNSSAKIPFAIEITKPHKLHNAAETGIRNGRDVTGSTSVVPDGSIVPADVLAVINYINANGSGQIPANSPFGPSYPDVNGDDQVVAADALAIINYINAGFPAEGEGTSELTESYFAELVVTDQAATMPVSAGPSDSLGDLIALLASDAAVAQTKRRRLGS